MENMLWVGLGVFILALGMVAFFANLDKNKLVALIGLVGVIAGIAFIGIGLSALDKDKLADFRSRFRQPTKAVVEVGQTQTKDGECFQSFKLDTVSYTLEAKCSKFFVGDKVSLPRVGDFMKVMYILPKTEDGTPEVVSVDNLTQELEQAGGTLPCKPENPAHNLEAPSVSPESPPRSRSRTLPAPRAE